MHSCRHEYIFLPCIMRYKQFLHRGLYEFLHGWEGIMRLNESSMEKLLDLMTMALKFQFLRCCCGEDILDVALNHVFAIKRIAQSNREILDLVIQAEYLVHEAYDTMSMFDFRELRQQLALFFQDRKVKVGGKFPGRMRTLAMGGASHIICHDEILIAAYVGGRRQRRA